MSAGPDSRLDPVGQIEDFRSNYENIGGALEAGVGGVVVTVFAGIALGVDVIRMFFTEPLLALIDGLSALVTAIVGGSADIINQGVETAVLSIAPGAAWAIGPLTFALSIAVMGSGLFVLAQILARPVTSDTIPFSFTDFPIIGTDEEGEGD